MNRAIEETSVSSSNGRRTIVIAIFVAEPAILQRVATVDEVFVPAIALDELYYAARKLDRAQPPCGRSAE